MLLVALAVALVPIAGWSTAVQQGRQRGEAEGPLGMRSDPYLTLHQADREANRAGPLDANTIRGSAQSVLRSAPLDPIAVRQMGQLAAPIKSDASRTYLDLAERISRRDAQTQLLLIQDDSQAYRFGAALAHYDRFLSTHPDQAGELFPRLARGLALPEMSAGLRRYADRAWFAPFLSQALNSGAHPAALVGLYAGTAHVIPPTTRTTVHTRLLAQLVGKGNVIQARQLVGMMDGPLSASLETIGFSGPTSDARLGLLSWTFHNDAQVETATAGEGALEVRIAPTHSAVAAERTTLLGAGRYEVMQDLAYDRTGPRAALSWTVACAGKSSRKIWEQALPNAASQVTYRAYVTIPDDCPAQLWRLRAYPDETQLTSQARLSGLVARRIGSA